jgi:hypothetical protein
MTISTYSLPPEVGLNSARIVADDLLRHIHVVPAPVVSAQGLRQGSVPLLQILVAARRQADALGKPFRVEAPPGGTLAVLLATFGLDPAACGAEGLGTAAHSKQGT